VRQTWKQRWRPAGGWPVYAAVLLLAFALGGGGIAVAYVLGQPPKVRVITPVPLTSTSTIRAPVPHASTRYVTRPPVTVTPSYPQPVPVTTTHPPPSSGGADIPGVSPYAPQTGGEPLPTTDNPTPGVTAPPSPSSPSQGGGF
jgi:hypothetical protein